MMMAMAMRSARAVGAGAATVAAAGGGGGHGRVNVHAMMAMRRRWGSAAASATTPMMRLASRGMASSAASAAAAAAAQAAQVRTSSSPRSPAAPQFTIPASFVYSESALANRNRYANVLRFVEAFRAFGHLRAQLDPLGIVTPRNAPELSPEVYGIDLDGEYDLDGILSLPGGETRATGRAICDHLTNTYCHHIGAEFMHVPSTAEHEWFAARLEGSRVSDSLTMAQRRNIYSMLVQSEAFDHFMTVKFATFKRYGLEGAEGMIAAVDAIFAAASQAGVERTVIGMPHRGRLNLLVSLLQYPARALFHKIKGGTLVPEGMDGYCDVVSHIFTTVTKKFDQLRNMTVTLLPNPSHLEAVNPVSLGNARAKQDERGEHGEDKVLCLQLHGDAAFAGQGVVSESLMMVDLPGFRVGGTVHMIVNNQVGFTTSPDKSRSTPYSSDVGRIIGAPVLHVNADDPESVVFASRLAVEYRMTFKRDVIIDLIGFRKHGHNEVDEPAFTHPLMYKNIRSRKSVVGQYADELERKGIPVADQTKKLLARIHEHLESELAAAPQYKAPASDYFGGLWNGYTQAKHCRDRVDTGVDVSALKQIGVASVTVPEGFIVHPRLRRGHVDARLDSIHKDSGLDWATAEALAFGSLLRDGYNVRLAGQDVERGTFSHRHGVLVDQTTQARHTPFLSANYPGTIHYVNSLLSEFAVLGFEYGYNLHSPKTLGIWEAQYGDFANTAQVMIDNFVTSGEGKWLRANGLVLMLPHGYDGTGPEHSSSRVERFLQLSDDDPFVRLEEDVMTNASAAAARAVNVVVANCTTPAQYFHILRRQMLRTYRKPLVLVTPKTLLRLDQCTSKLAEFAPGTQFQPVLADAHLSSRANVTKVVLCSGKVYYELVASRTAQKRDDIAFVRVEELSPFPWAEVRAELDAFVRESRKGVSQVVWFQEEHANAGAWSFVEPRVRRVLASMPALANIELAYVGRQALGSSAVGNAIDHKREVATIFKNVFA